MVRERSRVQIPKAAPFFRRTNSFVLFVFFMEILDAYERYSQYVLFIKNYSPITVQNGKRIINIFTRETGINSFKEVSLKHAQKYFLNGRVEKKWMSNTYISHHKYLNVFWKWCIKNGYTAENPFSEIEKPRLEKKLPRKLTKEQAELLLDVSRNMRYRYKFESVRNYAMVAIMLFSGLRRCEVLELKLRDVDTQSGIIQVIQGKGKKDRFLPMNFTLRGILDKYLIEREKRKCQCLYFFVSSQHDAPLMQKGFVRYIKRLREVSKLDFSGHTLRHTFATLMLEGGCDIYTLSKLMGHSDITTTSIYLSASEQLLKKSIEAHPLGRS
jgi:site-specific recombinase XerD